MNFVGNVSQATLIQIFLDADEIVKSVMILLFAASIFSWALMISGGVSIFLEKQRSTAVRQVLGSVETRSDLKELADGSAGRVNRIVNAMASEWAWSDDNAQRDYVPVRQRDYALVRQRLASVLELSIADEYKQLAGRSAWLATIGSSAPFVGLFGTVWGIMNSFIAISQAQESSLAVVAPGMAEALLATAVGLFCAIPASIGYNRIVQGLAEVDQEWRTIGSQLEVAIARYHSAAR